MTITEILAAVDHTQLSPAATKEDIRQLCDEARQYHTASVCVAPARVRDAVAFLRGEVPVCTVIGFPNGYSTTAVKCAETHAALEDGADEIDMVINLGWVKDGAFDKVQAEIAAVRQDCIGHILKVIVETCLLTEDEKIRLCAIVAAAGADFIKTSTGFSTGGATLADIDLFRAHVPKDLAIKAAGGIATLEDACTFLEHGATRLGTSRVIRLVKAGRTLS